MDPYFVPAGNGEAEFTEKRSRFIGRVRRTDTERDALDMLRSIRETYRDATHNVYAYRIRENNLTRYSDDGEPSGTSGMPVLSIFAGAGVTNACCVVTRYFGGTLLGTGGLARAYARAARMALEAAGVARMASFTELLLTLPYPFYERARRILSEYGALAGKTDFGADVRLNVFVRAERADGLIAALAETSAGKIAVQRGETSFRAIAAN